MRGPFPDPKAIDRFRRSVETLVDGGPAPIGVAVSGGPDSLALLLLARGAWPDRVRAATVDHRLRPESAAEAAFVAELCAGLAVPHRTLTPAAPPGGNLQSAARTLRYRLLGRWATEEGIGWIATAHHLDDQAETLLMRLLRGSGVSGLAGIRRAAPLPEGAGAVRLIRPVLGWRRSALAGIVSAAGIEAVADPGNVDPRYDRARIRALLSDAAWIDAEPLARSAGALAEAEEALAWGARVLAQQRIRGDGSGFTLDPAGVPAELRRRLVLDVFGRLGGQAPPRGEALQRLLSTLEAGEKATLAGIKCRGGPTWSFGPAPPRRT